MSEYVSMLGAFEGLNTKTDREERQSNSKKNNNEQTKSFLNKMSNISLMTPFGGKTEPKTRKEKSNKDNTLEMFQATLDDFVEEFKKNKSDPQAINSLMAIDFGTVAKIMTNYFDKKYESIATSFNNVIKLMTTKTFAMSLNAFYDKREDLFDNWEEIKLPIVSLIALAIETSHTKMMEETLSIYTEILEDAWSFEIKELTSKFQITEDAALELLISVPNFRQNMSDTQIRGCYDAILNMLLNHGKTAIQYLNAENQKELFYWFFKDENRIAVKAAGQCLGDELLQFEEAEDQSLYEEYIKALYMIVNEHDIEEIRSVLRYIVKVRSKIADENRETITVFDVGAALEYPNIKTAMLDYIDHSESAKKFLV